jgi:2-polyprenyl-3-methyl-5-hydroxy-6-metoxy-1,4-benzoquinol methylase
MQEGQQDRQFVIRDNFWTQTHLGEDNLAASHVLVYTFPFQLPPQDCPSAETKSSSISSSSSSSSAQLSNTNAEEKKVYSTSALSSSHSFSPKRIKLAQLPTRKETIGGVVWDGCVVLTAYLGLFYGVDNMPTITTPKNSSKCNPLAGKRVIELGSGHGLLSIVAHFMGASEVVATDYEQEDILNLIKQNVFTNIPPQEVERVKVVGLNWEEASHCDRVAAPFDVILGPKYSDSF